MLYFYKLLAGNHGLIDLLRVYTHIRFFSGYSSAADDAGAS